MKLYERFYLTFMQNKNIIIRTLKPYFANWLVMDQPSNKKNIPSNQMVIIRLYEPGYPIFLVS